jgi:hypothetical protein
MDVVLGGPVAKARRLIFWKKLAGLRSRVVLIAAVLG